MSTPRINPWGNFANMPAHRHAVVTPDDSNDLAFMARALFIGATGDVEIHDSEGNAAIYSITSVPYILPVLVKRVLDTNTTVAAGKIIALW